MQPLVFSMKHGVLSVRDEAPPRSHLYDVLKTGSTMASMTLTGFARLMVGVLVLGSALFLALEYRKDAALAPKAGLVSEDAPETLWQESLPKVPTEFAGAETREVATPDFSTPSVAHRRSEADLNPPDIVDPPAIADRYRPLLPFRHQVDVSQQRHLVPVQPKSNGRRPEAAQAVTHIVRAGDTLQSISREYFGTPDRYLEIFALNRGILSNPADVPEGCHLKIPSR